MRKPLYVTIAGWACLALAALGIYAFFRGDGTPIERRAFAAGVAYTLSLCGFFVAWAGGTARARALDKAREELARKLAESPAFQALRKIDLTGARQYVEEIIRQDGVGQVTTPSKPFREGK